MATKKDFEFDSGFKERTLTFESDKIVFSKNGETFQVMMDWETPIMKRSAEWVTNGGKAESVLEIGYGMGIAASFIQAYQPDQHTIMELHPNIAERAEEYANQRNKYYSSSKATAHKRVTIMGGKDWYTEFQKDFGKSGLQEFDAIFIDTYKNTHTYISVDTSKIWTRADLGLTSTRAQKRNALPVLYSDRFMLEGFLRSVSVAPPVPC